MKTFKYYLPVILFFVIAALFFGTLIYIGVNHPGTNGVRYSAEMAKQGIEIFNQ